LVGGSGFQAERKPDENAVSWGSSTAWDNRAAEPWCRPALAADNLNERLLEHERLVQAAGDQAPVAREEQAH
jgi:hypothetical protein